MIILTKLTSRWGRRLTAVALTMALLLSCIPSAFAVTQADIDALKAQQSELKDKMSSVSAQISELEAQENSALDQALLYQQQMGLLSEEITETETIIADYEEKIEDTKVELAEAQETEELYYELFCERVRDMEETGSISYWAILFEAANFSDLLDRLNFIKDVIEYDNDMVKALEAARDAVADCEAQLEEEQAAHEAALADLEEEQLEIEAASAKNDELLAEIRANEAAYADRLAELEAADNELAANIVSSEAAYQQQLEALRKQAAAEEAARKAAETAKTEETKVTETETKEEVTSEPEQETAEPEPEPEEEKTESKTEQTTSVPSSGIGASVANYACQFIGNPYVYGGESLTEGCDCSGFVKAVYAHFGYSLPHSSWSMASCGTGVSYSQAEPGDIIFYQSSGSPTGGHVGI